MKSTSERLAVILQRIDEQNLIANVRDVFPFGVVAKVHGNHFPVYEGVMRRRFIQAADVSHRLVREPRSGEREPASETCLAKRIMREILREIAVAYRLKQAEQLVLLAF